ncbi:MAG TPA: histidine phosphatase family protein [Candidatus Acidoferrales bacterium]|nr:histidine phosphatase family protein [Candidatus Acidoferrales bacterium]
MAKRLTLVRHGETVGQSSIRYYGATDVALSELGIRQIQCVRDALAREAFDAVYSSELQRTTLAARIIAPQLPLLPMAEFNEINFGDWEGLTREEIAERDPQTYARWRERPHDFTYPSGDTLALFRARVANAFRNLLPSLPERTLMVVHRGIISTIVAALLDLSASERAEYPIDLASIHVLSLHDGKWRTELVNGVDHLGEAA